MIFWFMDKDSRMEYRLEKYYSKWAMECLHWNGYNFLSVTSIKLSMSPFKLCNIYVHVMYIYICNVYIYIIYIYVMCIHTHTHILLFQKELQLFWLRVTDSLITTYIYIICYEHMCKLFNKYYVWCTYIFRVRGHASNSKLQTYNSYFKKYPKSKTNRY